MSGFNYNFWFYDPGTNQELEVTLQLYEYGSYYKESHNLEVKSDPEFITKDYTSESGESGEISDLPDTLRKQIIEQATDIYWNNVFDGLESAYHA